jgi:hypothetical protein
MSIEIVEITMPAMTSLQGLILAARTVRTVGI